MCLIWYERVLLFAWETPYNFLNYLSGYLKYCLLFFSFHILKVDGLIRLMEGENTGPINIGNPGYTNSFSQKNRDQGLWVWFWLLVLKFVFCTKKQGGEKPCLTLCFF